jgi:hypothetical protein
LAAVLTVFMLPAMLATTAMTSGCLAGMNPLPAVILIRSYPLQYLLVLAVIAVGSAVAGGAAEFRITAPDGGVVLLIEAAIQLISVYVMMVTMRLLGNFAYYAAHGATSP